MLAIPRAILDDVLAHGREGLPDEICGIFAGKRSGDRRELVRHYRVRNAHPRPRGEYLIDPADQLRLTLEIEDELGLEVIGFYHSHPIGPPHLSRTDAARATWPGVSYFLAWYSEPQGYGSWTWDPDRGKFLPEAVEVV